MDQNIKVEPINGDDSNSCPDNNVAALIESQQFSTVKAEMQDFPEELATINDQNQFIYYVPQNIDLANLENVYFAEILENPLQIDTSQIEYTVCGTENKFRIVQPTADFSGGDWNLNKSTPLMLSNCNMINVELDPKANTEYAAPSPHDSDSGLGNESQDINLSWLLNFKLDEIPALQEHPTQTTRQYNRRKNSDIYNQDLYKKPQKVSTHYGLSSDLQHEHMNGNLENMEGKMMNDQTSRGDANRKPPFTYTELIEHALTEKGALTVSGIYQWISDHFAYYKVNDDRWKNSVRHNLSINPHFRKGNKSVHGAGHLWTIAQKDDIKGSSWKMKKQRMANFFQITNEEWQNQQREQELELATATASILPEEEYGQDSQYHNAVQITQLQQHEPVQLEINNRVLNAVKPEIEIQYIIPMKSDSDFLCPVTKEEVAEDCGLMNEDIQASNDFLIADFNPAELGFDLSGAEIVTSEQLFSEDLCLEYAEVPMDQN